MNFFEHQDRARRNSVRLVFLLALAVLGLILATIVASAIILTFLGGGGDPATGAAPAVQWPGWDLILAIAVAVIGVVVIGGLFKRIQLGSGGRAVAEALDGRLIHPATTDPDERKVLNVVEEMALAAGTPVPPVYLLEDAAINAFAAGRTPQDAVVGVTRGCIRQLSRDELQGVVAHEFSHIIHGDMRLNTQLIATLHGILLIGLIGYFFLRLAPWRRGSNRDNSGLILLALGLALIVIGFAGTFFGNLIKSAVSRQREFLADASAVQYTRNPDGIAGALKKIGASQHGSRLEAANAVEYSHMFFGQGVKVAFGSLMATHPPLPERIRRIQPQWDGDFSSPSPQVAGDTQAGTPAAGAPRTIGVPEQAAILAAAAQALDSPAAPRGEGAGTLDRASAQKAIEAIGQPGARHLEYARQALAEIDPELQEAAHDPYAARALVYGLLLAPPGSIRERQLRHLQEQAAPEVFHALRELGDKPASVAPRFRLALIDIALPSLKQMSPTQQTTFRRCLDLLVEADERVSLMEWALRRIVVQNLEGAPPVPQRDELGPHAADSLLLLSALAHEGAVDSAQARAAFEAAVQALGLEASSHRPQAATSAELEQAVNRLDRLKPAHKHQLLNALALAVEHDGVISVVEAELLRAVADSLHCPLPPLLAEPPSRA
ncbi:MAG: M48 family metallopeptidase [Pigmentiphaga sp.]